MRRFRSTAGRLLTVLLFPVALLVAVTPAAAEQKVIRIGYEPSLPPLNYLENEKVAGFTIDLLKKIFEDDAAELQFVPLDKSQALTALARGNIDLIASIPFSRKQAAGLAFSDPFYLSSVGILTPRAQSNPPVSIAHFSGRLVSLQRDTVEYDFLRRVKNIRYQVSGSQLAALEFFLAGRAEIFVGNVETARYYLQQLHLESEYTFVNAYFMSIEFCFGVAHNNQALRNQLNSGINRLKNTGIYSDLYTSWFGKEESRISYLFGLMWKIALALALLFSLVLYLSIRWNRELKSQVASKTQDLKELNDSLVKQIDIAKNNNEFLNQIIESSLRSILILNKDGTIARHNNSIITLLGCSKQIKGQHYKNIEFINDLIADNFEPIITGSTRHFSDEAQFMKPGSLILRHFRYSISPLYQYNREIIGLIVTLEDITGEVEIRQKIFDQEKHRALSLMVAGIAHEVRNPLSAIKTFVELIPSKLDNKKFRSELTTIVPREITRVSGLIESLVGYARQRKARKELVSTGKIIDETITLLIHDINSKGISLVRDRVEDHVITVDHDQVEQAVINLLINAIDTLGDLDPGASKKLEIRSLATARHVMIQICDNGQGMSQEEISCALEPFFTTKAKGTGLGLPLAQQLARESGGELNIESEKGRGTTVTLTFARPGNTMQYD